MTQQVHNQISRSCFTALDTSMLLSADRVIEFHTEKPSYPFHNILSTTLVAVIVVVIVIFFFFLFFICS
jgi:hypothetical protein